jgi:hypothetical protein
VGCRRCWSRRGAACHVFLWCVLGSLPALTPVLVSAGRAAGSVTAVVNAHGLGAAAG